MTKRPLRRVFETLKRRMTSHTGTEWVDAVPVRWLAPSEPVAVLIHVPAFGQTKEQSAPVLNHVLERRFAAVAIDAYRHGERGTEEREAITKRVFANFRREMWTIIGETALDLPRVVEWARAKFGADLPLHLTGTSMGGDVVVAAAPFIDSVASVNAVIATPDWERPGMRDEVTGEVIPQGRPDPKAQFLFDGLNPINHPERFYDLKIHFIVGEKDTQVPAEAAYRFKLIVEADNQPGHITITEKPGLTHRDFVGPAWFKDLDFTTIMDAQHSGLGRSRPVAGA
jgi:alpha-beta hydrolase superfamily lysophospholipase